MATADDPHARLRDPELLEKLAAAEHERWAHWQQYMHQQCIPDADGSLIIPARLVRQWTHQIETRYADLTEAEKDSDRDQVARYLPVIEQALLKDHR